MKKLLLIAFALFSLSISGCGLLMLPVMIDKLGDFAERMAKIEAEKRAELRKECHSVEGEILSSEVIEKEIEVKKLVSNKFEINSNDKSTEEPKYEIEKIIKKFYQVKFVDGRDVDFADISEKPLNKGNYYIIKYNGLNEIISVEKSENGER